MAGLDGEAVVITGAGQGLGAAYARAAAAHGAAVVVNDLNAATAEATAAGIRQAGGRAVAHPCDIRDPAAAEALIGRCVSEYGFISGLVNNAGVLHEVPFEAETVENLRAHLEVNVIGLFNCARAAVGPMLARGRGSIVNATSGAQTGQVGRTTYGASKGAVASFTYGWAGELKDRGVRVNAISPMAATPMSAGHSNGLPAPEVNAPVVLFLLSDRSRNVTGQVVRIVGTKLSLMAHPANRAPVLEREAWSLDSVAEAFETVLAANLLPTDVATYEIARVST
jgi:NAD(P)-dependent dehydrogenase (short-subunit alcohol dehydrogenase family)